MAYIDLQRSTIISRLDKAASDSRRGSLSSTQILKALRRERHREPDELCRALVGEGVLFRAGRDRFIPRSRFFDGGSVFILPRQEEIEAGILIPGHRFLPLYDMVIGPSELSVRAGSKTIPRRMVSRSISDLQIYYSIFGIRSFPFYLSFEAEENAKLFASEADYSRTLAAVSAFDLHSYYEKWQLQPGEGLWATLTNWRKGEFTLSPARDAVVNEKAAERFIEQLDDGFMKLMEEIEWPLPPQEELARSFFRAGRKILEQPPLHVGGYLARSERIGLMRIGDDTYLWDKRTEPDEEARSSAGMLDARLSDSWMEELVKKLQIPVPLPYIEGCVRDQLRSNYSFLSLIRTVFAGVDLTHLSEKDYQQLISALEGYVRQVQKRWRADEESKRVAYLHRQSLHIYQQMTEWLDDAEEHYGPHSAVDKEDMQHLSELLFHTLTILELLHSSGPNPDDEQLDYIEEEVSTLLESYPSVIERIRQSMRHTAGRQHREDRIEEAETDQYLLLDVHMNELDPPVTRRLRVPSNMDLADLHEVLQTAFGWTDSHLHAFIIGDREYGDPELDEFDPPEDEAQIILAQLPHLCSECTYVYDFGDDWSHHIRITGSVKKEEVPEEERETAVCLQAHGAAPPEDCGGLPGYEELVKAARTPQEHRSAEQRERLEFYGDWHPEAVSLEDINTLLRDF